MIERLAPERDDMSDKLQRLTKADMTEAQRACFDLLCDVFHGEHHAPERIYAFGRGIKCNAESQRLSTFDFDYLTRLVGEGTKGPMA